MRPSTPIAVLATRTAGALTRAATAVLSGQVVPDPWYAALSLRRCERIAAFVRTTEHADRDALAAQIDAQSNSLRTILQKRQRLRANAGVRPYGLIALQAERQFQVFGAQCNHRPLLLNPIERVQTVLEALGELSADLEQQTAVAPPPAAHATLGERIATARVSFSLRLERATALREITPVDVLLGVIRTELNGAATELRRKGTGEFSPLAALGYQRRLLETEYLTFGLCAAFGDNAARRVYRRAVLMRRRMGAIATTASLTPVPSPAAEGA